MTRDLERAQGISHGRSGGQAVERLWFFVSESNRIEGIRRDPTPEELDAHDAFLRAPLTVESLEALVAVCAPGKRLRTRSDMNVRVGNHVAPRGGPNILRELRHIVDFNVAHFADPWSVHVAYETLHPFMDGNGRSGRALWLWQMLNQHGAHHALEMGFLHLFYYQTLQHSNRSVGGTEGATVPSVSESTDPNQASGITSNSGHGEEG